MLGKLIKHEFKSTGRYILLIMALLAIITPVAALYIKFSSEGLFDSDLIIFDILMVLCVFLYIAAMIAVATATVIILLYRFYKSMVSAEGYLTHTLPVKTSSLIISKALVATVWTIASYALIFLSILVFTYILGVWDFNVLSEFSIVMDEMKAVGIGTSSIVIFIIMMLVSTIVGIITYYLAFAFGHRLNGHPILGSILAYMVISIIVQIISTIFIDLVAVMINMENFTNNDIGAAFNSIMLIATAVSIVQGIVSYILSVYIFKNKLNI